MMIVSTYAGNAEIAAALGVNAAGLKERLAFFASLESTLVGGSSNGESGESQSEENGGFEELHCITNERMECEESWLD